MKLRRVPRIRFIWGGWLHDFKLLGVGIDVNMFEFSPIWIRDCQTMSYLNSTMDYLSPFNQKPSLLQTFNLYSSKTTPKSHLTKSRDLLSVIWGLKMVSFILKTILRQTKNTALMNLAVRPSGCSLYTFGWLEWMRFHGLPL